ncbi:MAG: hypothetical protein WD336_09405 [Trueperaceae bacterium]
MRRDLPSPTFQDDLFSGARWLQRTTGAGVEVRVRVSRVAAGLIRIERYERRGPAECSFERRIGEEGRVVPFRSVDPTGDERALFGSDHDAGPHAPNRER